MSARLTTKDAFGFIALSQQDLWGIYWMIWEPMMIGGAMAFQHLLEGFGRQGGQATLPHPALGQVLLPSPRASRDAEPAMAA